MRINYQCHRPQRALGDIVESIWVQEDPRPERGPPSCVIPTGTAEILFHYGDRFVHATSAGPIRLPRSYVTGQRTRPVFPAATGTVGIVIVSLCPWALSRLFPVPAAELTDGYLDLRLLIDAGRVERLEESLACCRPANRIGLVESFLLELVRAATTPQVRGALSALTDAGAGVDQTARALGWSGRHLRRRFLHEVGVTPKSFQRISRFQRALGWHRVDPSWSAAAAACGFADQAHLIREARALSGRTPREIGRARRHADEFFNAAKSSRFFSTVYV